MSYQTEMKLLELKGQFVLASYTNRPKYTIKNNYSVCPIDLEPYSTLGCSIHLESFPKTEKIRVVILIKLAY